MPRVKIDYVISFSSEIADAPANNLLANEAGRGRWLCARGEPSCSVLLQLARAVQISSVTIGAEHAALVEVLVGRSETPTEQFQVLVASSVFLSPLESRRLVDGDSAGSRVRTFSTEQLASDVRLRKWDRVRVVCTQPYNKHCKHGMSFIHIFSPEGDSTEPNPGPGQGNKVRIPFSMDEQDSEDEFKPGALFAQHRAKLGDSQSSTDSQIRQASSQALKNQSDSASKLVRTPIAKPKGDNTSDQHGANRQREQLLYDDEDDRPDDKIDRLVAAHKEQQSKNVDEKIKRDEKLRKDKESEGRQNVKRDDSHNRSRDKKHKEKRRDDTPVKKEKEDRNRTPQTQKRDRSTSGKRDDERSNKKQRTSTEQNQSEQLHAGPVSSEPHTLLRDVVFVLSGYENPRRAAVRDAALAMGARFSRDWGNDCTHLICAFPNTPKLKTVRSSQNGDKAVIVTAEWIERSAARCRRLPWQWFATEHKLRVKRARAASGEDPPGISDDADAGEKQDRAQLECDTDDEIEKVLQAKRRTESPSKRVQKSPEASSSRRDKKDKDKNCSLNSSCDSDVAFVKDERVRGNVTVSDSDSDATDKEDEIDDSPIDIGSVEGLPLFFDNYTFALHCEPKPVLDVDLVKRYVKAYGGELVEPLEDEEIEVDYVLCLSVDHKDVKARGTKVRGDWLWKCHKRKRLCSPGEYAL